MYKSIFDFFSAIIGLFLLSPFFLLFSILIKCDSDGPVFYRQVRVGRLGSTFRIHKFRTMFINSDHCSLLTVGDDNRVTKTGKFLRKYKLDELPQLIDVLLGNMSLVGPRPEVQEFIDLYPSHVKLKVLSVKPGITDLASIEMVDENLIISKYPDPREAYINHILPIKQRYYIDYVENHNIVFDIKIIFLTLYKILARN